MVLPMPRREYLIDWKHVYFIFLYIDKKFFLTVSRVYSLSNLNFFLSFFFIQFSHSLTMMVVVVFVEDLLHSTWKSLNINLSVMAKFC
jgi:hypothetical protein